MLKSLLKSTALLAFMTTPALALTEDGPATFEDTLVRIEYGAFCARETTSSIEAPGTENGTIDLFEGMPNFQWRTHQIPAAGNISFGVKTKTLGALIYQDVTITLTHPPFGGTGTTTQIYTTSIGGENSSINAYSFDFPHEMVTGDWTFTATQGDLLLYSVTFQVVDASLIPTITQGCGGALLS